MKKFINSLLVLLLLLQPITVVADDTEGGTIFPDDTTQTVENETTEVSNATESNFDNNDEVVENNEKSQEVAENASDDELAQEVEINQENNEETEILEEKVEENYPIFSENKIIDDVIVSVNAEEGVFPEGSKLSVEKVVHYVQKQVDNALNEVRDEEANVVASYTFDIKILDQEGNEIQPKDDSKVKVSFTLAEASNENLDTNVYHIDDKQEEITPDNVQTLDVVTEGEDVVVETNGFSIYTVEFTYNNKEYVLEGDTYVRLSDILDFVGLTGEVESWEISNNSLFTILKGDEYSISYDIEYIDEIEYITPTDNPDGNILYMVALQMFDTEEWLDVTIDGITYRIVVTDDAYVDGQSQTKITDSRVEQGGNETNFTADMPLATIFINEDIVNMNAYQLLPPITYTQEEYDTYVAEHGEAPSWNVGDVNYDIEDNTGLVVKLLYDESIEGNKKGMRIVDTVSETNPNDYGLLYFDFSKGTLSKGTSASDHVINTWSGPVAEYRFINAAERFNVETQQYEKMDVIITYSNINISLQYGLSTTNYNKLTKYTFVDANKIQPKLYATEDLGTKSNDRTGLKLDVNIQVVDKDDNLIPGSYYFPLVDADIKRTTSNPTASWGQLYQASSSENNMYSEMFMLLDNYGQPTSTGEWEEKIWIPGGDYNKNKSASQTSNMPYLSMIDTVGGKLRIKPGATYSSIPSDGYIHPVSGKTSRDEDFYTGFATLANNTEGGIEFRYWGDSAAQANPNGSLTVTSFVLAGTQRINHKLDASSNEGGTIYTTTTGNAEGNLSGGELMGNNLINTPHEISAATGQNVTYTLSPNGGYKIKNVYVKQGDIDIMPIVLNAQSSVDESSFDSDGDGVLNDTEKAAYEQAVTNVVDTALAAVEGADRIPISSLTDHTHGIYSYTFSGINEDNSIHVEWEKTQLSVSKNIEPADPNENHRFNFHIRLWDTSTEDTVWRVRARKYNGTLIRDNAIGENTPYYMTYHENHYEEGDIENYILIPDSDFDENTNPKESGWFEKIIFEINTGTGNRPKVTRYIPTEDTEPVELFDEETGNSLGYKEYYRKEVTQGNVFRNFQHILGYNEETGLWESYDIKSIEDNSEIADTGLFDPDEELGDNFRFEIEEGKVWLISAFDSENDTHTKYLMWIYDAAIDENVLVAGNEEIYPDGIPFEPSGANNNYVYIWENTEGLEDYTGKIIKTTANISLNGQSHLPNSSSNKYKYEKDLHSPVHYDFINNPDGYTLDSGYSKLDGEAGMYLISMPAGQTPDLSAFDGTSWDLHLSRVAATGEVFDMDAAFIDKGATPVSGANTYAFSLAPGETIDFEGCVPMGWNYEIIETGLEGTIWQEVSHTPNANISDFDGEEDVEFINQKRLYNLTIKKQTINDAPGTFSFKVKVWKETVIPAESEEDVPTIIQEPMDLSTQFGNPDSDGYYSLTLSNNDSVTIEDILYGYNYEIIEVAQDNWRLLESTNASGMISSNTTSTFTNEKIINLTIRKEADEDTGEEFEFEVKIWEETFVPDENSNVERVLAVFTRNQMEPAQQEVGSNYQYLPGFVLPSDSEVPQYITDYVNNLPEESRFEAAQTLRLTDVPVTELIRTGLLTEFSNNKYEVVMSDWMAGTSWASGIQGKERDVYFKKLKKVDTFMDLSDLGGKDNDDGSYTFKLKSGESLTVNEIPYGYKYEIYELDSEGNRVAVSDIFNTKWQLKSATNTSGTLEESTTSLFTNEIKRGSIKVNKETKGNEAGEFKFKVKVYKEPEISSIRFSDDSAGGGDTGTYDTWGFGVRMSNLGGNEVIFNGYNISNIGNSASLVWNPNEIMYYSESDVNFINTIYNAFVKDNPDVSTIKINGVDYPVEYTVGIETTSNASFFPRTNNTELIVVPGLIEGDIYIYPLYFDLSSKGGTATSEEGVYEFTINNGENFTIDEIPFGFKYEVYEETPEGWDLVSIDGLTPREKAEGTIESEEPYEHTFLNAKRHKLVFEKKVSGNMGDKYKEFGFEVRIYGENVIFVDECTPKGYAVQEMYRIFNGGKDFAWRYILFKNPDINKTALQNKLPYYLDGSTLYVKHDIIGYPVSVDNGEAYSGEDFYGFHNGDAYLQEMSSELIGLPYTSVDASYDYISIDEFANATKGGIGYIEYLDLSQYGGSYTEDSNYLGDGVYTFKLKHGDKIEIEVPYGYTYEIVEKDYSNEGYKQSVDGKEGREVTGELTEDKNHLFENRNQVAVPTEVKINYLFGLAIFCISGIVLILMKKFKKSRHLY